MKRRIWLLRYVAVRSCQYAWQSFKNGVRVLRGREPRYEERLIFFRQYFLHLTGLRPLWAITCALNPERVIHEGAGSQALLVMWTISTARACGLKYLHTPFTVIAHADRPMKEWVAPGRRFSISVSAKSSAHFLVSSPSSGDHERSQTLNFKSA